MTSSKSGEEISAFFNSTHDMYTMLGRVMPLLLCLFVDCVV